VDADGLKLTTCFGEHDRAGGRLLSEALTAVHVRHGVRLSVVLRGVEGFGIRHRLQTDRLLTLSEDLPLVSVAVDARPRIEAVLADVEAVWGHGLLTLERARLLTGAAAAPPPEEAKLTVHVGRGERPEGVVAALRDAGTAGATVLLGVDGSVAGVRHRARFAGGNGAVPALVVCVGDGATLAAAWERLAARLPRPLATLERVQVCKRDGVVLREPAPVPPSDAGGPGLWQKLTVYVGEQARHDGLPLHGALVRRLRAAGAAGATSLRGTWGFHGDHAPHGDRFWALRRRVPVVVTVVDAPDRIRAAWAIVDELTTSTGLVTSEVVPALRAGGPGIAHGGLRLASP
jgi:PII-like signaling protein